MAGVLAHRDFAAVHTCIIQTGSIMVDGQAVVERFNGNNLTRCACGGRNCVFNEDTAVPMQLYALDVTSCREMTVFFA